MTTNTAPPDERALRLPEFEPGVEITLSDGRPWHFRVPTMADFYPSFGADGAPRLSRGFDAGPDYETLLDSYVDASDAASELALLGGLAFRLLARNYAIEPGHLRWLLRIRPQGSPDHEGCREMWQQIADVCTGNEPKKNGAVSAAGSASA